MAILVFQRVNYWGAIGIDAFRLGGQGSRRPGLLGAGWPISVSFAVAVFGAVYWVSGRVPAGEQADPVTVSLARRLAERMALPAPRFVRHQPGWTAGAVRVGRGYGLVIGEEVEARHREAVLAHELAHVVAGDLAWEPFTDGIARIVTPTVRKLPPIALGVFPFLLLGAPLARATELRADDIAATHVSTYPSVIKEVAAIVGSRETLLYPSLEARARRSARRSIRI